MTAEPTGPVRFNHVAMSVDAAVLDDEGRAAITDFYEDVFGWEEHPTMTLDRERLVMAVHAFDQFVFLIAEDEPMRTARLDHFGLAADTQAQLDAVYQRACARRDADDRVEIIDPMVEDHGVVKLHNFYVRYLLPMWVEVQFFEFPPAPAE